MDVCADAVERREKSGLSEERKMTYKSNVASCGVDACYWRWTLLTAAGAQDKKEPEKKGRQDGGARKDETPAKAAAPAPKFEELLSEYLPKGDYDKVKVVTVEFPPGGEATKHRHDVAVVAYVLDGAVESQLEERRFEPSRRERPGTSVLAPSTPSLETPASCRRRSFSSSM